MALESGELSAAAAAAAADSALGAEGGDHHQNNQQQPDHHLSILKSSTSSPLTVKVDHHQDHQDQNVEISSGGGHQRKSSASSSYSSASAHSCSSSLLSSPSSSSSSSSLGYCSPHHSPPHFTSASSSSSSFSGGNHHLDHHQNIMNSSPTPPLLQDFYRGRSVFITGGTGFVGKVLIEKLLYSFRDIGTLFVLMRPKTGQLIRQRREELLSSTAFDRVRSACPAQFAKVVPVVGDIALPGLGINPLDLQAVTASASVIFHSAATIRFDEPLKYALKLNTMGTKRVLELAKKLKSLAAFVHVSTAYCTVKKINIEEKVYREPISPEKVLEMADWMDDATFNQQLKEVFYQGRPCSYHYTKSLAEHLIGEQVARGYVPTYAPHSRPDSADCSEAEDNAAAAPPGSRTTGEKPRKVRQVEEKEDQEEEDDDDDDRPNCEVPQKEEDFKKKKVVSGKEGVLKEGVSNSGTHLSLPPFPAPSNWRPFPAAIIRPSIITCAWREPFPGWIDNYNGTTGFMVVSGKGVLRTIHVNPDYVTDVVPVDVVINACIGAAWYIAACRPKSTTTVQQQQQQQQTAEPEVEVEGGGGHGLLEKRRTSGSSTSSSGLSSAGTSDSGAAAVFADGRSGEEAFVVNCVSGSTNAITWAQLRDISTPLLMKYPSSELFRVPGVRYHRYEALHKLNLYLEHTIPAVVTDFMFRFLGHTPVMDQVYQKVHRTIRALEHFTMNEWTYRSDNLLLLDRALQQSYATYYARQRQLSKEGALENAPKITSLPGDQFLTVPKELVGGSKVEKETPAFSYYQVNGQQLKGAAFGRPERVENPFPLDLGELDWTAYFTDYVLGVRKYLLKEDPETIPQARRTLLMLKMVFLLSKLTIGGTVAYQLLNPRSMTRLTASTLRSLLAGLRNSSRRLQQS